MLGIAGKNALEKLEQEQKRQADAGEDQHTGGVLFPAHLFLPVHPQNLVYRIFAGGQNSGQNGLFPVHDLLDVGSQGDGQPDQDGQIQCVLDHGGHTRSSPFIKM